MIRSPGRRNSKLIGALYWGQGGAEEAKEAKEEPCAKAK
jgi:hypothetical protein